ncbi:MAG: biotin/lipoyl-binding protein, partial [Planctomycetaceae bacterium]|nr:biotin/lipoyl-binding protein [Planctomycetaceae bacterium]
MIWDQKSSESARHFAELDILFPSLQLAKSSRWVHRMAKWLVMLLVAIVCFTAFAPWQQYVSGKGRVVAFDPLLREQVVQSPISGRVASWSDGIREGTHVKQGQTIVEVQDLDPDLLLRLKEQVEATERELESLIQVWEAYESQVEAFRIVRQQSVAAADEYIKMAQQKLKAEQQNFQATEAALLQVEADYERQKMLAKDGLASTFKQQVAQRKKQEALAKMEQAKAYIASAQ